MSTGLIVALVLAVGIGLSLGLLGGGGTILAVPLLTYVAGMSPQEAIASSMFIIGVTALISVGAHARRGNVHWRTGLIFGVASMVGAGGGFLVVPALVLLGGLAMPAAVGTSLLIIALKSFSGMAGYLTSVSIDWTPVLMITAVTVVGAVAGSALSKHVPEQALKTAFGYFVLGMGVVVLIQELPMIYGTSTAACIVVLLMGLRLRRRRRISSSADGDETDQLSKIAAAARRNL